MPRELAFDGDFALTIAEEKHYDELLEGLYAIELELDDARGLCDPPEERRPDHERALRAQGRLAAALADADDWRDGIARTLDAFYEDVEWPRGGSPGQDDAAAFIATWHRPWRKVEDVEGAPMAARSFHPFPRK